jgi:hypothetical protein
MNPDPLDGLIETERLPQENPPMCGVPDPEPPPRPVVTVTDRFGSPEAAPLGTAVVFPEWQDKHHPRDIAIRWCHPDVFDERTPWIILNSDGPQRLSNDCVVNCEWLPLADLATELGHNPPKASPTPNPRCVIDGAPATHQDDLGWFCSDCFTEPRSVRAANLGGGGV